MARFSWGQFIDYTIYCTNIQGSALYDATLGDKELIEQMYKEELARNSAKIKEQKQLQKDARPPRRGYTRTVEALYDLTDNIVALRGEMGRWSPTATERQMSKRPWFPGEVVALRMRNRTRTIRDQKISEAHTRWRTRNG